MKSARKVDYEVITSTFNWDGVWQRVVMSEWEILIDSHCYRVYDERSDNKQVVLVIKDIAAPPASVHYQPSDNRW